MSNGGFRGVGSEARWIGTRDAFDDEVFARRAALGGAVSAGLPPSSPDVSVPTFFAESLDVLVTFGVNKGGIIVAERYGFPSPDPTDKTRDDVTKILQRDFGAKGVPRQAATSFQVDSSLRLESTGVRAAVHPAPDRIWILDTYGDSRIRILRSRPLRFLQDLPIAGGPRAMALSPDRSKVFVLRNPTAQGPRARNWSIDSASSDYAGCLRCAPKRSASGLAGLRSGSSPQRGNYWFHKGDTSIEVSRGTFSGLTRSLKYP